MNGVLFPSEVGRYLAPLGCLPLDDGVAEVVGVEPLFCAGDNLVKFLCLWCAFQFCLAFVFVHPQDGVVGIAVDGLVVKSLLPTKSKGMNNSEELPDIVRALEWTEVKHSCPRG